MFFYRIFLYYKSVAKIIKKLKTYASEAHFLTFLMNLIYKWTLGQ